MVERQSRVSNDIHSEVGYVNTKANDNVASAESVRQITATLTSISNELDNVVQYFKV